jgi:acetyl-CoA synthetase
MDKNTTILSVSKESRIFPPLTEFSAISNVSSIEQYQKLYERSLDDPDAFWLEYARQLHWTHSPTRVLHWSPDEPGWQARWFDDGTTNVSYNCLDRNLHEGRAEKPAIVWEGERGETRTLSYHELWKMTCKLALALHALGVRKGDRVGIYMGMVPEAAAAMLACARIGAIHSVVFGGFASEALADRMNDAAAKVVITQDGAWRRGQLVPMKENVDRALQHCPTVQSTIVLRHAHNDISMRPDRDIDWAELLGQVYEQHEATAVESEHPLFILYTSGTTGKPKGVVHTTGGYMVGTYVTYRHVFDLKENDVYWCTADIGWVTGHSYVVYGPLLNGATVFMYEGAPNFPDPARYWSMIERHRVTIFYTAPTAIRAFVRWGDEHPAKHDLSSLRLLGTVGEPINPEAWMWYHRIIGQQRCPIVDTWWQTETGAIMISPLPGATPTKPGSCTLPMFGVAPKVVREDGSEARPDEGGYLIIDRPWPSMLRTVWGDHERFVSQYFSRFPGAYFTGDGARRDADGYFWVMGRVDDVVNVAGHRLGTAEIESALVAHPSVAEAAVVARPDELTGQALVAFVTLKGHAHPSRSLTGELMEQVAREIGKFARPAAIRFTDALPKTRSGKIMRRLLKEIAAGQPPRGDLTTLEDIRVLAALTGAANEE